MDCPKCAAPHPAEAVCCSVCHHPFKAKKAPTAGPEPLAWPRVDARFGDWVFTGPLVATPEALYFFVAQRRRQLSGVKRLWALALGQSAGLAGGVLLGGAIDAAGERAALPRQVRFGPVAEVPTVHMLCPFEPTMPASHDYFKVPRASVRAVQLASSDLMVVECPDVTIEVDGPVGGERVSAFLRRCGYALEEDAPKAWGRRGLRALGWVAAAAAVAALGAEVYELNSLASLPELRTLFIRPDGSMTHSGQYLCIGGLVSFVAYLAIKGTPRG